MSRGFPDRLKERGRALGFDLMGITSPAPSRHMPAFRAWLEGGAHGDMAYLARPDAVARRADLDRTMPGVGSVVVVGMSYFVEDPAGVPEHTGRAVIARYARGQDYHLLMEERLQSLLAWIEEDWPGPVRGIAYVDTGPILERELGQRAGLGWFGKNTMLIHPRRGSYFFLGTLLLDIELPADASFAADHCGTCERCLGACPTGALLGRDRAGAPLMDARRCISYLTIEHRGPIPPTLRPLIGNRVFGCDICQEVCPWNERFSRTTAEPGYSPRSELDGPSLVDLTERVLSMSGKAYQRAFHDSPLARTRRRGMLRNLCVALGNWGDEDAVPVLSGALVDPQPLVRGHAAWALGRVASPNALDALARRRAEESDPYVVDELTNAGAG